MEGDVVMRRAVGWRGRAESMFCQIKKMGERNETYQKATKRGTPRGRHGDELALDVVVVSSWPFLESSSCQSEGSVETKKKQASQDDYKPRRDEESGGTKNASWREGGWTVGGRVLRWTRYSATSAPHSTRCANVSYHCSCEEGRTDSARRGQNRNGEPRGTIHAPRAWTKE